MSEYIMELVRGEEGGRVMDRREAKEINKFLEKATAPKEMTLEEWQELDRAIKGDAESATTTDCISRQDAISAVENTSIPFCTFGKKSREYNALKRDAVYAIKALPSAEPVPCDSCIWEVCNYNKVDWDVGEVSDGYHTFNQLYHQRAVLFATIVNQNKDKAWKSWKHEDGKFCFDKGGEWFIVGVDTPEGSYTYHYEKKYWDMFECEELDMGKHWDGHTEEDVTRLLSLQPATPPERTGEWVNSKGEPVNDRYSVYCSRCKAWSEYRSIYCGNCGARMKGGETE